MSERRVFRAPFAPLCYVAEDGAGHLWIFPAVPCDFEQAKRYEGSRQYLREITDEAVAERVRALIGWG